MAGWIVACAAAGAPVAAAQERPTWLSETGRNELGRADLVCIGTVRSIRPLRATVVVEIRLDEVIHARDGKEPDASTLRVLATDPRAFHPGQQALWFLDAREAPGLFQPRGRHVLGNPEGADRLAVLRQLVRIEAVADPQRRRDLLRRMLLANLGGRPWVRWHAITELFALVERVPGFLAPADIAELESMLATPLKRSFHQYLVTTICRAQVNPALERLLTAREGDVRGRAAGAIAAVPPTRRTAYLLGRMDGERHARRRARLCELLGMLAARDQAIADAPGPPGPRNAAKIAAARMLVVLRERFFDDRAPVVRSAAAQALVWCDPAAVPLLLSALDDEPAPTTRAAVAMLLGRLGAAKAVRKLEAALAGTLRPYLRVSMEVALARLTRKKPTK